MSTGVDGAFKEFWKIYPKKVGKGAARKAWKQVRAPTQTLSEISTALSWQNQNGTVAERKRAIHPQSGNVSQSEKVGR